MNGLRARLGQYEILAPLGSGGMGEVYVARDPSLGRKVAIKLLPIRLSGDRETLARFTREARSASALNHPNIVTIHEVGMDQGSGSPYIVMEFIDGRDLRGLISDGPLPNQKTLDIAAQIADGLAAAHEQGIIHRDLKPENVMVTKDGYVKILDFGLAKVIRPAGESDDDTVELDLPGTNPGTILGTIGYMSPEQATGKPLDFRSDQFALGAILYELATGRPAFEADNAIDTLSAILHEDPPPISRFNVRAPQPFCWIVERLLSKAVEERYSSTRDLASDLRNIRDRFATTASGVETPFEWPSAFRKLLDIGTPSFHFTPPGPPTLPIRVAAGLIPLLTIVAAIWIWQSHRDSDLPSRRFVAVIPFSAPGQNSGTVHFAEGLSELVSARLASVPELHVVASPLVASAPSGSDLRQIAAEEGVTLLLTGVVQRTNDLTTVRYAVIDAENERAIVSGSISVGLNEAQRVEDGIVADVCRKLHVKPSENQAPDPALHNAAAQRIYVEALGVLADEYSIAGIDRATRDLTQLLNGARDSPLVNAALGRACLARYRRDHNPNEADRAIKFATIAAQSGAPPKNIHALLGQIDLATGRWRDAIAEFETELVNDPQGSSALDLAKAYEGQGDFYDAIGRYRRIVVDRLTGDAFAGIGRCEYLLGHFDRATTAFEKAVQLAPADARSWGGLAVASHFAGQTSRSQDAYRRAVDLGLKFLQTRDDASIHADVAVWLVHLGQSSKATDHLESAFQIDRRHPVVAYDAALMAALAGRSSEAVDSLRRAEALGYSHAAARADPQLQAFH
jgi:serine/threonine protein kinase/tetratricopeptide (TPR) repeat protein